MTPPASRHVRPGCRLAALVFLGLLGVALGLAVLLRKPGVPPGATAAEALRAELELREGLLFRKGAAEPFTGVMLEQYPDGALLSRSTVVAGRLHGLSEGWYPDGRLQVREHFVRGVSQGERIKWHANGATQSVAGIVEGQLHGRFLRWHENGALAEEMTLNRGRPDGWARSFYPSGFLKARVRLAAGAVVEQQFWPEDARCTEEPTLTVATRKASPQNR